MTEGIQDKYAQRISRVKILHILSEKHKRVVPMEHIVPGLDGKVFSQVICYLRGEKGKHSKLESLGHEVINLDIAKEKLRGFQPAVVFQIARIMKEYEIDIVHCQRHKPTVYGTLAAYIVGGRVKVISHVRQLHRTRNGKRKLLNWALFKRISRIIAVSDAVRDDILRNNWISSPRKVVTVHNGIDAKLFIDCNLTREDARIRLGLPEKNGFVYGTVGRLEEAKGPKDFLQAFSRVCQKYPDVWFVLAGKGELESELRALAVELDVNERVVFLGYRNDIPEILRALDVFVFPSIREGLPNALLEAMAAGIPVIASPAGGVPEILNRPGLGIMVPSSSVDELTAAMERVCSMDEVERKRAGKALEERVLAEFTKEKMIAAMTDQYLAVMNESS